MNRITTLKLAYMVWGGKRFLVIKDLHQKHGKFVRTGQHQSIYPLFDATNDCVGPNTLSINSQTATAPIYTVAQSMEKSDAYRPGRSPHGGLFFIQNKAEHHNRRRIWAPAFSNEA
jgi:hypothetical protein